MCLDSIMLLRLSSAVCLCSLALVQITHCLNPPFCYVMTVLFKVACMHLLPNNTCRQSDHAAQSLPGLSSQLCKKVYIINVEREKSAVSENGSAEPASCLFSKKKKQTKKQCNLREVIAREGLHAIWAEVEFSTLIINDYCQRQCNQLCRFLCFWTVHGGKSLQQTFRYCYNFFFKSQKVVNL